MKTIKTKLNLIMVLLALLIAVPMANAFYMAEAGRWINRDPITENGFTMVIKKHEQRLKEEINLYAFVKNSPISSRDSFGLQQEGDLCDEEEDCPCSITGLAIQPVTSGSGHTRIAKASYTQDGCCADVQALWWSCTHQGNYSTYGLGQRQGTTPYYTNDHHFETKPDGEKYMQRGNPTGVGQATELMISYLTCEDHVWTRKFTKVVFAIVD